MLFASCSVVTSHQTNLLQRFLVSFLCLDPLAISGRELWRQRKALLEQSCLLEVLAKQYEGMVDLRLFFG